MKLEQKLDIFHFGFSFKQNDTIKVLFFWNDKRIFYQIRILDHILLFTRISDSVVVSEIFVLR